MNSRTILWEKLRQITFVRFIADSRSETGWSGAGVGTVVTESPSPEILLFTESGRWTPARGKETRFSNVFRWSALPTDAIRLEHLRFGLENPVHLFDISCQLDGTWTPNGPHICSEDCYSAVLRHVGRGVDVTWSITGPKKNESIRYEYR